jgi:hypothetical protein
VYAFPLISSSLIDSLGNISKTTCTKKLYIREYRHLINSYNFFLKHFPIYSISIELYLKMWKNVLQQWTHIFHIPCVRFCIYYISDPHVQLLKIQIDYCRANHTADITLSA